MNIPNAISLFRIALVPVFVAAYHAGDIFWTLAILLLCGASDVLDGVIARRFNIVTDLGKILDPVADKLIQAAMMFCAAQQMPGIWLLFALHLLRELSLGALGLHVKRVSGQVHSSEWYGKLCTASIYVLMLALLLFPGMPEHTANLAAACCGLLMVFCLFMYGTKFIGILKEQGRRKNEGTDRA